jgi:hypothetical protein
LKVMSRIASRLTPIFLGAILVAGSGLLAGAAWAKPCRMRNPDLSVYDVRLADSESAIRKLGAGPPLLESEDDLPRARFVTKNGAQELTLYAPYSAPPDEYGEAEVRFAGTEALTLDSLPVEAFVTGRGIALGMTPDEVIARFGKCMQGRERRGATETIQYVIDRANNDPDLKTYGYPLYYAEYEFERRKLVRFRFGFASQ